MSCSESQLNDGAGNCTTVTVNVNGPMPAATQKGQVLFSLDGLTFTPQLPLTSPDAGWLCNDTGELLVVA